MLSTSVPRTALLLALLYSALPVHAEDATVSASPEPDTSLENAWHEVREVDGVPVLARDTDSGFDEHLAEVSVCADIPTLERFVTDTDRFPEWVAFTRSARLLDRSEEGAIYYVRSTTPWPLADRDMVYRISRVPSTDQGLELKLTGLPGYQQQEHGVTRIEAAEGAWRLIPDGRETRVRYRLYVDPGRVPAFIANRRLATAVGQTLANLADRFPCARS
ncbi:MAG: SRPBCC family protein [Pseudomonadales bacterium]|jgi:hypothetical protein